MDLEAIETRAYKADASICAVAGDPKKFRMSIPPQPDDTDELVVKLAREDVPALVAEVRRLREALEKIVAIENKADGGDWDEIAEARLIAREALK